MRTVGVLVVIGLSATLAILGACVGEDSGPATSTPTTDSGGTPDSTSPLADSGGDPTVDSGPDAARRHCETATKPVEPTEFFCADFDGTEVKEGWTNAFDTEGGTLAFTTAVLVSPPHALIVHPANAIGNGTGPQLQWASAGAKKFAKAQLRAHMNPTNQGGVTSYVGTIKLLEITTTNALVALYYANGGALASSPPQDNYVGYFIKTAAFGGAAAQQDYPVATALTETEWTDVNLTWQSGGQVNLTYNDVSVFNKALFGSTDTSLTFSVGAASSGDVREPKQMRYDDVEITLDRAQ